MAESRKKSITKKRVFDIIQIGNRDDIPSHAFDIFLVIAILLNIAVLFMETFDGLRQYTTLFEAIEAGTILVFCIEYILRIWTAEYLYPKCRRNMAVLKFLLSFDGIVELFTILPLFFLSGFIAFRMLRVVRIFHLFRINSYYDSFNVITSVLYEKKNQIFSSIFIIFVLMLSSSLCMYSAEHEAQPEVFNNAFSGLWWSISTILTVGYGDIYPITIVGRVMAIGIAFLGVGVVAIPTGIISAGFVERYTQIQTNKADRKISGVVSVKIDKNSIFVNRYIKELERENDISVVLIIRDGNVMISSEKIKLKVGDTIVYNDSEV